ncbi:MAG TPA: TetR/AcrR family transcriptional regulator [Opitutales bacterium]|jgi:AcrR family transcriptional regulator|nr:TetR/AcrR family transcriptional regulator [Opitutales bacterium]
MSTPRKSTAATRERLIRAAERCFTEHGFDGASLRQITKMAGVNLASVNYHFSSKRELWLEVMQRRLVPLNAERVRLLETARAALPAGKPVPVEQICDAMLLPLLHAFQENRSSSVTVARMVGRAINVPQSLSRELNRRNLDQFWRLFHNALRESLPEVPAAELDWKFYFLMSSMIGALAWQGRQPGVERQLSSDNLEPMVRRLSVFIAGGLRTTHSIPTKSKDGKTKA